jgi:hypothetical protein
LLSKIKNRWLILLSVIHFIYFTFFILLKIAAHVVFNTVPSPLVIDEDDKLPVQSVQESENKADDVKDDDDDKNLNGDMHEEQESMSPSGEIEDVPSSARHGKGVDNIKLTSKDDEYEEEKNEKHQDVQKDINESDEGREKPHQNKDSHHEEVDETEMENDESANKDSLDNDD